MALLNNWISSQPLDLDNTNVHFTMLFEVDTCSEVLDLGAIIDLTFSYISHLNINGTSLHVSSIQPDCIAFRFKNSLPKSVLTIPVWLHFCLFLFSFNTDFRTALNRHNSL